MTDKTGAVIFDFETTGIPSNEGRKNFRHESQPWPVSVAAVLLDTTKTDLPVMDQWYTIINLPDRMDSHPRAFQAHGISREQMDAEGIQMSEAMDIFRNRFIKNAVTYSSYNLEFDENVALAMALRLNVESPENLFEGSTGFCLLKLATNYLKIPGGNQGYRSVKLFQAYRRICGVPLESVYQAHNALDDTLATAEVYRKMMTSMVV